MKPATTLALTLLASLLLASCGSTPLAIKPTLTKPSVVMLRPCDVPVTLPEAGLTVAGVEDYWLRDRAALLNCSAAKLAVQDYYDKRDRALSGNSGTGR